jgi:phosphoserine phosphatase RsbU/P
VNMLIVDDDEIARTRLLMMMREYDFHAEAFEDGADALEHFRGAPAPLIITDWMMPNIDGLDLIRGIRSSETKHYVYIIMMTSKDAKSDLIVAMEAGADAFLTKPVGRDELRVSLRAALRVIELEASLQAKNAALEIAYETIRKDIAAAGTIQKALLPIRAFEAERFSFRWLFRPFTDVGGDIFNVQELSPTLFAFYVIDVSGHGVEAALLAVTLSRMLTPIAGEAARFSSLGDVGAIGETPRPADIATSLNTRFVNDASNSQFFTLMYGMIDTEKMTLTYTSAGHKGSIFMSSEDGAQAISEPSFPICFTDDPGYTEKSLPLNKGDRLYFFTDGLYETANNDGTQLGIARITDTINRRRQESLSSTLDSLYDYAVSWSEPRPIADDVSILAFEVL